MSKDKILLACILAIPVLWMLLSCMPRTAQAVSPPFPVVSFPFDVSKRGSVVNELFRIRDYRSYYMAIRFDFVVTNDEELWRGVALIGDGSIQHSGTPKPEGVVIPIKIRLSRVDEEKGTRDELIYEKMINTENRYAGKPGSRFREIFAVDLKPGLYRVEAETLQEHPEFSYMTTYLHIEPHSKIKILPDTINSDQRKGQ